MNTIDNGGANAIKGFNYQKSVIALIAILNYQKEGDFQIYVESEDDIVVTSKGKRTYIQAKSKKMSLAQMLNRVKGKDSILEKSLANGDDSCSFKVVTPDFIKKDKHLSNCEPAILTQGATVYTYTKDAVTEIETAIKNTSKAKIQNSRVALTVFKANHKEALNYIIGVMSSEGMSVDNSYGKASLQQLGAQIDERSEIEVKDEADYDLKKFTRDNLATIFTYSLKLELFNKIIDKLGYNIARQAEMQRRRVVIGAIYRSLHGDAIKFIEGLDLNNLSEREVVNAALQALDFETVEDETLKEVIIVDAFSQVVYERTQA